MAKEKGDFWEYASIIGGGAVRYGLPVALCGINPVVGYLAYDYLSSVLKKDPNSKSVSHRILDKFGFKEVKDNEGPALAVRIAKRER